MESFVHQINDDTKILLPLALNNNEESFDKAILKLEQTIKLYKSKRLRRQYLKTVENTNKKYKKIVEQFPEYKNHFKQIEP